MEKTIENIKVLIPKEELYSKIEALAQKINLAYDINEPLNVICVLRGAVMFFSELVKYLKMPVKMEFVSLSSYGAGKESSGKVSAKSLDLPSFKGENVLIIEDILDTGLTLEFLIDYIKKNCSPKDVKLAVMFDKKCKRKFDITPDFYAFEVDDKFIVGFGLDFDGKYRNLNYIGYFED